MSEYVYAGLTSQTIDLFIRDSSSTTGQGLTGLAYNSGSLVASYRKGAAGSRVAITLATQTVTGAFSSGGFVEIDATNMPGCYRLDLPNAAVDTAGFVTVFLKGAANMVPVALRIDCRPLPADVKQFGGSNLTASSGRPEVNVSHIGGDAQSLADLKDFADAGYDPTTNAVTAVLDPATQAQITAIETFATRVTTGLVQDGAFWQFTANMLELAPSGGGGAGDASQATLLEVKAKTDLIGTAAGATTLLAAAVLDPGTITSFPETLTIGDSYTEQNGRSIQIPIVDTDGNPISSTGSLDFANASVTFTLQRSGETDSTRVITGTASFVDPPGTGTGAGAPYAVIEIPSSETAKGLKKYKYSGILTFLWSGTGTDVVSFETDTVVFDN